MVHIHTHTNVYILSSFNLKLYYEQFSNVAPGALDLNTHCSEGRGWGVRGGPTAQTG